MSEDWHDKACKELEDDLESGAITKSEFLNHMRVLNDNYAEFMNNQYGEYGE